VPGPEVVPLQGGGKMEYGKLATSTGYSCVAGEMEREEIFQILSLFRS
jgi:hypothetical protein